MLKFYNTLTRKKEEFVPIDKGEVTMYSCGPTVYNYAHIGNLRTYVFMDIVRRVLRCDGYKIKGVMNITDVGHLVSDSDDGEDKMQLASRTQKKSPYEIAAYYTDVFMRDIDRLNIGKPEIIAKATDNIAEMLDYVEGLYEKGFAYETSDGIYFDIQKFPEYGKLSGINLDEQKSGARVEVNSEKRHPADFALWKKAPDNHIMKWDSRWGLGYPGWHIECSAMCKKFLGTTIDIHTGGVDHIPIHHENEIAQSEALEGKKTVDYWLHGEFMLVDNGKMSKSLGNTYTIDDLEKKGFPALAFRYFCLNTHYRKKLNFTFEGLSAAKTAYERMLTAAAAHKASPAATEKSVTEKYLNTFYDAINDDLNIPLALGTAWTMLKEPYSKDIYETVLKFDTVLGLSLDKAQAIAEKEPEPVDAPAEVTKLATLRLKARQEKNWAESDRLRDEIAALGYTVIDQKDGYKLQAAPASK